MSTKRKLIISLCSICLVAAVVVIGVFAFATQTFSINNRVTFTATDVKAKILIKGTNGGNKTAENPDGTILFPDGSNALYSAENSFSEYGDNSDGQEDKAISFAIEANEGTNLNTVKTIPDQVFSGQAEENKVEYVIKITNDGSRPFSATIADASLKGLETDSNISVSVKYNKGEVSAQNGAILSLGETLTVTFTYILVDQGLNADLNAPLVFNLQSVDKLYWQDNTAESYESGTGTEADPYIIMTPQQLALLAKEVNNDEQIGYNYYQLGSDIDLAGKEWACIGNDVTHHFNGSFDGNNYKVTNIEINNNNDFSGLFGNILGTDTQRAVVKNLTLTGNVSVNAIKDSTVGGVVGYAKYATIERVNNAANVQVFVETESSGGGIVAKGEEITITRCSNTGTIRGEITSNSGKLSGGGGIIGYAINSDINNSYNSGDAKGYCNNSEGTIAAVVGQASGSNLSFLINYGSVYGELGTTGTGIIGGIIGQINNCTVSNSINLGTAEGYPTTFVEGQIAYSSVIIAVTNGGSVTNTYGIYTSSELGSAPYLPTLQGSDETSFTSSGALANEDTSFVQSAPDSLRVEACYGASVPFAGYVRLIDVSSGNPVLDSGNATWSEAWDFTDIWTIDSNVNNGLPTLQ